MIMVKELQSFLRTISHNLDAGRRMLAPCKSRQIGDNVPQHASADRRAGDRRHHGFGTLRRIGAGLPQRPVRQQRSPRSPPASAPAAGARAAAAGAVAAAGRPARHGRAGLRRRDLAADRSPRGADPPAHRRDRAVAAPQPAARSAAAAHAGRRRPPARGARARLPPQPQPPPMQPPAQPPPAAPPGRRGDVFDPSQNPNAPGAPRVLGTHSVARAGACPAVVAQSNPNYDDEAVGAPGGRARRRAARSVDPGRRAPRPIARRRRRRAPASRRRRRRAHRAAPARRSRRCRRPTARATTTTSPTATSCARTTRSPKTASAISCAASRATGWCPMRSTGSAKACSSASAIATPPRRSSSVSTKFETNARAPDALLRLGQSLAAMGEREAACASLAEVAAQISARLGRGQAGRRA